MKNKEKIQQREIIVTEFSDGTFLFDGIAWNLIIPKKRATEFFDNWRKGLLNESSHFDNKKPRMMNKKINV